MDKGLSAAGGGRAPWKVLPEGTWLLQQPIQILDLEQWNGFGFSTQLDGNSWLNMVYAKPNSLVQTTLTPGYYTALVITILIFRLRGSFRRAADLATVAPPDEAERRFMHENRPTSLIGRLIEPREIADFVTFVSSPLSSAINGAALRIDGGLVRSVF
jgi:hypothetical protein